MPEGAVLGAAGAVGEDDDVGDDLGRGGREDLPVQEHRAGAVVVLLADGAVGADDDALERALAGQLEQDLGGDGRRDHAAELVGGAAAEEEVLPLGLGRHVAQLLLEEVLVDLRPRRSGRRSSRRRRPSPATGRGGRFTVSVWPSM